MKSLSALIEQYKSTPSQVLKDEIFNRVISLEDTTILDRAESDKVMSECPFLQKEKTLIPR